MSSGAMIRRAGALITAVIVVMALAFAGFAGRMLPAEFVGLVCLIGPAVIAGTAGFVIGRRGRPVFKVEFEEEPNVTGS